MTSRVYNTVNKLKNHTNSKYRFITSSEPENKLIHQAQTQVKQVLNKPVIFTSDEQNESLFHKVWLSHSLVKILPKEDFNIDQYLPFVHECN